MMRKFVLATGVATVAALSLAACSGGSSSDDAASSGPVTLTLSGWSLDTTPEFQALADAFHEENPDVTVEVVEYAAGNDYDTLMTADLAAGSGPDIITQKNLKSFITYQSGGQLADVSDVELPDGIGGAEAYEVDGATYAVPYRQDSWVLFYNKALFDQAGLEYPDGSWTWDDYADAAEELTTNLGAAGSAAKGTYQHSWQSTVQGFANAQTDADILEGDYAYLKPYYDRVLGLQSDGAQVDYNTVMANKLTYQAEFGKQNAALMPMGTWYVATLIAQQASGDADDFEWGFAPIPQEDSSTTGTDETPVTFGDPTGFAINSATSGAKLDAAKEFLAFAASESGADVLAGLGITPALTSDSVADTFFAVDGAPGDDLSKFAWSTHDTKPENPTSAKTAAVQNILNDLHTSVMSGSASIDDAISTAEERVKNEVGIG